MLGVIPYYEVPVTSIGPIDLDPWAMLVCAGFIVGLEIARARGIRLGLDVRDIVDGALFVVGSGFLVGHLVHVLAYHPETFEKDGVMSLVKVWTGFSSTGGFIGAVLGAVAFYRWVRPRPFWQHADTLAFAFPFGWLFGRLGCSTAHDHVGRRSDFLLALDFPGGSRHDLGLYEAMWMVPVCVLFWALRKREVGPGFFAALFALSYAPVRFLLDFLRNEDLAGADVRWGGLTPAQYGMIALMATGGGLVVHLRRNPG